MDMMMDVKQQISDWIAIAKDNLNDISLEDVEMSEFALENIESATLGMAENAMGGLPAVLANRLICKSYWIEHTRELVLFFLNAGQAKAVVIPAEGWMLRGDITLH